MEGVTYTVRAVLDGDNANASSGDLILELDREAAARVHLHRGRRDLLLGRRHRERTGHGPLPVPVVRQPLLEHLGNDIPVALSVETPKDGEEVSAAVTGITDSTDSVASANFHYEWVRVDGTEETDIGAVGGTYTPTADDVDKHLRVRVVFDDDAGYLEYPRTSPQFGPVVDAVAPIVSWQARADHRHHHSS